MNNLLAQINLNPAGADFDTISSTGTLTVPNIISALITMVLIVAAVIFFFMLIIGGLRWILSGGDKAQTETARNQITAALVGLVIVFAAFAIARLVQALFGLDIFTLNIPDFLGTGGTVTGS